MACGASSAATGAAACKACAGCVRHARRSALAARRRSALFGLVRLPSSGSAAIFHFRRGIVSDAAVIFVDALRDDLRADRRRSSVAMLLEMLSGLVVEDVFVIVLGVLFEAASSACTSASARFFGFAKSLRPSASPPSDSSLFGLFFLARRVFVRRPVPVSTDLEFLFGAAARFGFLLGQQRLPVGDRDLVIIGMDFREGEEALAVAAIFHERRLERRLHARHLREIDVSLERPLGRGLEIKFLDLLSVENDHPGLFRVAGVDKHALGHEYLRASSRAAVRAACAAQGGAGTRCLVRALHAAPPAAGPRDRSMGLRQRWSFRIT